MEENRKNQDARAEYGTMEKVRAVLRYMVRHNDRHAEQLSEVAHECGPATEKRLEAILGIFEAANAALAEVLAQLEDAEEENLPESAPEPEQHTHIHVHDPKEKKRQLARLSRVIGHLEYVRRMLEADEDCADVLIQISASKSALNGLGKQIINEHIAHCIYHAIEEGDTEAVEEFQKAIQKYI